ncbi:MULTISPECIES: hypothetical protein [Rhodopseudomonas]|uniref:hypothetical protein n=1 Tax=Rhodopseudomonas TaxID=1073 RepID=UPI000AA8332A|nr:MULTISPECIES: hypothetical protein [Rhodopseudomonas]MDF3811026.1 hypothetical protein [Rhodopseudomonas sp. BAL398]
MIAPLACAKAVSWSLDMPFEEALKKERECFLKLHSDDQSKAQRYAINEGARIARSEHCGSPGAISM